MTAAQFVASKLGWPFADGVATLTLDRPERKNPLTFESYAELRDLFRALVGWRDVKAVVITGAGGYFSSASDVLSSGRVMTADDGKRWELPQPAGGARGFARRSRGAGRQPRCRHRNGSAGTGDLHADPGFHPRLRSLCGAKSVGIRAQPRCPITASSTGRFSTTATANSRLGSTRDVARPRNTRKAAMAKPFATDRAPNVIDKAVQLHGGLGVVHGHIVEGLCREVRALRIYEGASEVQRVVIADLHIGLTLAVSAAVAGALRFSGTLVQVLIALETGAARKWPVDWRAVITAQIPKSPQARLAS